MHVEQTARLIESLDFGRGDFVFLLDENEVRDPGWIPTGLTFLAGPSLGESAAALKEALAPLKSAASRCFHTLSRSNGHEQDGQSEDIATIHCAAGLTRSDGESRGKSPRSLAACSRRPGRCQDSLCVVGGNAVASWVARVDEAAVRNTQDVDILLNRSDLEAAKQPLAEAGFVFRHVKGIDMFLDGPGAKARDAVHIIFAGRAGPSGGSCAGAGDRRVRSDDSFRVVALESLVQMKLTSFRDKDRTHLRDMIDVGLVDESWLLVFRHRSRSG